MNTVDEVTEYIKSLSGSDNPPISMLNAVDRISICNVLLEQPALLNPEEMQLKLLPRLLEHFDDSKHFLDARRMVLNILMGSDSAKRLIYFIKYQFLGAELFAIYKEYDVQEIRGAIGAITDFLVFLVSGDTDSWRQFVMRLWCGRLKEPMSAIDESNINAHFATYIHGGALVPDNVMPIGKNSLFPIWQFLVSGKHEEFDQIFNFQDGYIGNTNLNAFLRLMTFYIQNAETNGSSFPNFSLLLESIDSNVDQAKILALIKALIEISSHKIHINVPLTEGVPVLEIV